MLAIEQIKKALEEVRPMLAMHRGDVEFVKFEKGVVYVRMLGMCQGCPLSELTLKAGIEELLKSKIKEVKSVEAV
ncbi:MAG: NifU family protein [bacterium]|nr:NifU family protein [bacterium]